jgi:hypothetical protein
LRSVAVRLKEINGLPRLTNYSAQHGRDTTYHALFYKVYKMAVTPDQQQWHWQEGNKYALECMKALLLLNGGGALALLTFFGNRGKMLTADSANAIGYALSSFGIGTIGSVLMFALAYFTQLHYGNAGFTGPAKLWHQSVYIGLLIGLGGLIGGIWFARIAVVAALT